MTIPFYMGNQTMFWPSTARDDRNTSPLPVGGTKCRKGVSRKKKKLYNNRKARDNCKRVSCTKLSSMLGWTSIFALPTTDDNLLIQLMSLTDGTLNKRSMQVRNRIADQLHWGMKSSTTSKEGNVLKDRLSSFRRVGEPRATRQTSKSTIETEMTKRRTSLTVEGGQEVHLSESFHSQNGLLKRIIQTGSSSCGGRQVKSLNRVVVPQSHSILIRWPRFDHGTFGSMIDRLAVPGIFQFVSSSSWYLYFFAY